MESNLICSIGPEGEISVVDEDLYKELADRTGENPRCVSVGPGGCGGVSGQGRVLIFRGRVGVSGLVQVGSSLGVLDFISAAGGGSVSSSKLNDLCGFLEVVLSGYSKLKAGHFWRHEAGQGGNGSG
ncbi:hypothetical protein OJ253_3044 [Cryptosporidium canis]|uniref:Uncharacterized protein n=1 Tax=Cryptosporidium canis TaxID=195482 RepID=A0A9D5DFM4_9CRYT|nr:hypothetical protein OJ253_3044 [Cryptosporidium canis]